jgi:hypothetical protein
MHFTPLIFENFDYAWSFSAELSPEGLIGIAGSTLRYVFLPFSWPCTEMRKENREVLIGKYVETYNVVPIVPTEPFHFLRLAIRTISNNIGSSTGSSTSPNSARN